MGGFGGAPELKKTETRQKDSGIRLHALFPQRSQGDFRDLGHAGCRVIPFPSGADTITTAAISVR